MGDEFSFKFSIKFWAKCLNACWNYLVESPYTTKAVLMVFLLGAQQGRPFCREKLGKFASAFG